MSPKSVLIFFCLVSLNVFAETSIDQERSLADENIPKDFEDKANDFHREDRGLQGVKYGMTWGYRGYTPVAQETFGVHCYGTPTVPKYSPWNSADGGCNAYRGDTPCNHTLPILCISKCNYKRPCYSINCNSYAMNKEFYCGWSEGFIALSDPVLGSQMTSRAVGDRICAAKYGATFVMAEHHDGKWVLGMDQNNYCLDTWPATASTGGWGFYGYGVKGPSWTRFWVAINGQNANCW
jgi:hypothetical protein